MREAIQKGWSLKPPDAIHLATAKRCGVDEFHTYESALEKYSEIIGCRIGKPQISRFPFRPLDEKKETEEK